MLTPIYTRQLEKDIKRMKKCRKNLDKLKIIISALIAEEILDPLHRDHKLIGNWKGRRESDWLLIYKTDLNRIIFERTGTHSDLFKK